MSSAGVLSSAYSAKGLPSALLECSDCRQTLSLFRLRGLGEVGQRSPFDQQQPSAFEVPLDCWSFLKS